MKIHMRFDDSNPTHTRFTIFIDGKNCGQLCMGTEESVRFHNIVNDGCIPPFEEFISSGAVSESKTKE